MNSIEKKILKIYTNQNNPIVNIEQLAGDASTRQYFRLFCKDTTYIACIDSNINKNFIYIQKIFKENSISVPHIIDIQPEEGYILQEDLGDKTLLSILSKINSRDTEFTIYKSLLDQLIRIHKIDPTTLKGDPSSLSFDYEKLMSEVEMTHRCFLSSYLSTSVEDNSFMIINELLSSICKILSEQNFVFVHRDFHSKNIMCKNESFYIIDFQDARSGLPQYDLVSLLDDSYYSLDQKNNERLKKYYWDNFLSNLNLQSSYADYLYLYDLMLIQRTYKAIGSFTYIFATKNNTNYLRYLGFAFEKLRKVLCKYPEYHKLSQLLSERFYEN